MRCVFEILRFYIGLKTECFFFLLGSYGRPSLDVHFGRGQSHHCGQRSGCQGWRLDGRAGWHSASIRQYWTYTTGRLPRSYRPLLFCVQRRKQRLIVHIDSRFSTQFILRPNMIPKPYIRQRKKATRKKRVGKTRRQIGVRKLRRRTRRMGLLIPVGYTESGK